MQRRARVRWENQQHMLRSAAKRWAFERWACQRRAFQRWEFQQLLRWAFQRWAFGGLSQMYMRECQRYYEDQLRSDYRQLAQISPGDYKHIDPGDYEHVDTDND